MTASVKAIDHDRGQAFEGFVEHNSEGDSIMARASPPSCADRR